MSDTTQGINTSLQRFRATSYGAVPLGTTSQSNYIFIFEYIYKKLINCKYKTAWPISGTGLKTQKKTQSSVNNVEHFVMKNSSVCWSCQKGDLRLEVNFATCFEKARYRGKVVQLSNVPMEPFSIALGTTTGLDIVSIKHLQPHVLEMYFKS